MENVQKVMGVDVMRWTAEVDGKEHCFDYVYLSDGVNNLFAYVPNVRGGGDYTRKGGLVLILSELRWFCDSLSGFCQPHLNCCWGENVLRSCPLYKSAEFLFCKYLLGTYPDAYVSDLHSINVLCCSEDLDPWAVEHLPGVARLIKLEASNG